MPGLGIKQIIFDFCPAEPEWYLPLRAVSVEIYRHTQRSEDFIQNPRVYLASKGKLWWSSDNYRGAHQLCWAVRLGDLRLVKMLVFLKAADPHQQVPYFEATSDDDEIEVFASSLETAIARGIWEAVVEFAAHSPPLFCKEFIKARCVPWKSVPWHRLSK